MIKYLNILYIMGICYSETLNISPEIKARFDSDNEQYISERLTSKNYEIVINGKYRKNKLFIFSRMGYHLLDGITIKPSNFTREQGLHWIERAPGLSEDQINYYIADLKIEYIDSSNIFYLYKWDKQWGPGVNSLTISNKIPRFFHFGFKWEINEEIRFEYFHGKLKSGVGDINYSTQFTDLSGGKRNFDISRNIAGHRFEWQPLKYFIISGSELITYANRSIEWTYLLPFLPFFPIQTYVGETDNVIMSGDIQFLPTDNLRIFGVFIMDEWAPPYTFDKDNRNWFGWQTGFVWKNTIIQRDQFRIEYTWTDHRIYRHRFPVNDFYSWGYPVGFWAGPHAQEIYVDYNFSLGENHFSFLYSDAKRGALTDSMLADQYDRPNENPIYERFSDGSEEKKELSVSVYRNLTDKLFTRLSYTFVDWTNAGFNPTDPKAEEELPDITKHSLGVSISYRY